MSLQVMRPPRSDVTTGVAVMVLEQTASTLSFFLLLLFDYLQFFIGLLFTVL